jgi:hypothetical protein
METAMGDRPVRKGNMKKLLTGSLVGLAALAVPLGASLALPMAANAAPAASVSPKATNLSFSASNDGASAGWSYGKGSAIDLTLGSTPASTYAEITLHGVAGTTVSSFTTAPSFTTDNYTAGSPRYYITLDDGHTLWGYPAKAGLNGGTFVWAIDNGNTYQSWSAIQAQEAGAKVTGAYVIADGDQTPGTTDVITGLTFNGTSFN